MNNILKGKRTYLAIAVAVGIVVLGALQQRFGFNLIDSKTIDEVKTILIFAALWFIRSGISQNGGTK